TGVQTCALPISRRKDGASTSSARTELEDSRYAHAASDRRSLSKAPGLPGERGDARGGGVRIGVRRISIDRAFLDSLDDPYQPEQVVGEEPVEVGHRSAAGRRAIALGRLLQRRNAERGQVEPAELRPALAMRHRPVHLEVGE